MTSRPTHSAKTCSRMADGHPMIQIDELLLWNVKLSDAARWKRGEPLFTHVREGH